MRTDLVGDTGVHDRLARLADRVVARGRTGHTVMGAASGDGELWWEGAAGDASPGAAMTRDTPFFAASVTKLFVATSVLQLVEREAIELDAPMVDYLDPGRVAGIHRLDGRDNTGDVRIAHLLAHTSGIADYWDRPRGGRSRYRRLAEGEDLEWDFDDVVQELRDDHTPHFVPQDPDDPRARARYSDTNFQILIEIVEAVTGASFGDVLRARILEPLDLRTTWMPGRSEPIDPAPTMASLFDRRRPIDVPRFLVSCRDLATTTGDLLRLLPALMGGRLFDDPDTAQRMRARWRRIRRPLRYGQGIMRFDVPRLYAPGRRPLTLLGHSGVTGSWAFHCPELDLHLVGTFDQVRGQSMPFRTMVRMLHAAARR